MPGAEAAFDVITDPLLADRTANLKRNFALCLAAQKAFDTWYQFEDPEELAAAISKDPETFDPSNVLLTTLLELSSSIDGKMLQYLRDVGVGAPQTQLNGLVGPTNGGEKNENGLKGKAAE